MKNLFLLGCLVVSSQFVFAQCDTTANCTGAFQGTWRTNWGDVYFNSTGTNKIQGSYNYSSPVYGEVYGTITGDTGEGPMDDGECVYAFVGRWSETRNGVEHSGPVAFVIPLSDSKKFVGEWSDDATGEGDEWDGEFLF